ncbi:hypothetical protein NBRC116594_34740 [Shimia sp. NS0008-38b]
MPAVPFPKGLNFKDAAKTFQTPKLLLAQSLSGLRQTVRDTKDICSYGSYARKAAFAKPAAA